MATYRVNFSPKGDVLKSSETKGANDAGKQLVSMNALFLMALCIVCILCVSWTVWNACECMAEVYAAGCECMAAVYAAGITDMSNLKTYIVRQRLNYALAFMAIGIEYATGLAWKSRILACLALYLSPYTSFQLAYSQLVVLMILYKTVNYARKSNGMKCFVVTVIIITICTPGLLYLNSASETSESGTTLTVDDTTDVTQRIVSGCQVVSSVTAVFLSDLVSLFGVDKSVTFELISNPIDAFYYRSVPSVLRLEPAAWEQATTEAFTVQDAVEESEKRFQMQGTTTMDVLRNFANWMNPKSDVPRLKHPNHITATVISGISSLDGFSDIIEGECKVKSN
jgi:hypothetical protein